MEINNIITRVLLKFPLLANLVENLKFIYTTSNVPAPSYTDGKAVYYNDKFIKNYNDNEKVFIICHELFHILLKHLFRNIGKDADLLNYVEDGIINQLLIRAGLVMPNGLVYIEDALDYSVDELYMKYLSKIDDIKAWMSANAYHLEMMEVGDCDNLEEMLGSASNMELQEFLDINKEISEELLNDYQGELKDKSLSSKGSAGCNVGAAGELGRAKPIVSWQDILEQNVVSPEDYTTSFYEVQRDGIIKKETKNVESYSVCEIIIDSSGSMSLDKIRAILRECKNILSFSYIKVGFCDDDFYEWIEINSDDDIDKLEVIGRGGTSFETMAESFSNDADNKIVITDGFDIFPSGYSDIIWLVINCYTNLSHFEQLAVKDGINIIHINENSIPNPTKKKILSYS